MPKGHRETQEQLAYGRVLRKNRALLSPAAHYVFEQARSTGHTFMRSDYRFQPQQYYNATQKMRRLADELTDRDRLLLSRIARAALAAAASLATDDEDKCVWERTWLGQLYWFYRTQANMLGDILWEKVVEERRAVEEDDDACR